MEKANDKTRASVKRVRPAGRAKPARIETDPQGSWTGVPEDPWEVPVQDADDL